MALSKITTKGILDGTIATADLAANSVTTAKISADVIVAEDIANNAITVNEIQNGAVTSAKLDTNIAVSGTLGVTGVVTANAGVVVDNITIDGTEIDLSSGDLTLDIASDLIIDVDDGRIFLKDGGTTFGRLANNSTNFDIVSVVADKDIIFKGNDNGSEITALTLDMSDAGTAIFNNNVGVGASPNNHGGMNRVLEISASADVQLALHATSDSIASGNRIGEVAFLAGSDSTLPNVASIVGRVNGTSENQGQLTFHTRYTDTGGLPAERLRINHQGMFMLNGTNEVARFVISQDTQALNMCFLQNTNGTFGGNYFSFANASGVSTGNINQTGSTTVAYNTSSDYRLKENVNYDFDATTRLKQLKPARFNWIEDETNTLVDGFIAHEVSSIVPEAITGEKDATKDVPNVVLHADGTVKAQGISEEDWTQGKSDGIYANDTTWVASKTIIDAQGIDQSKLVPLLTKALQEQQSTIEALTARITTLENA